MSLRPFFNSIGNGLGNAGKAVGKAFKTGWNNGNLAKGLQIAGTTAFAVGMTGAMINDMKHSGSIFDGGCGCNSFGFGGGMNMFGCNPMAMGGMNMFSGSPFGMGGMNIFGMNNMYGMGGMNMFGGGMNMFSGMGMLNGMGNPYNTQMGNMMAFQWGQQLAMQQQMQMSTMYPGFSNPVSSQLEELDPLSYSTKQASQIESSVTGDAGASFDDGTTELGKNSSADPVTIADGVTNGRYGDDKTTYKNKVSTLAQSYIRHLNTDSNDQTVSEEEYIASEIETLKEQLPNASNEQLETLAKNAFRQMDLSGDGEIDWAEMASSITTFDAGGSNTGAWDGKISSNNYSSAQSLLTQGKFGAANWQNYQRLFGSSETE